ncbi:MAG: hypothetical protein KatS3mg124_0572 [Porticoccaceae bacterium]|nr:MAG: hypothetical protein KatS3mg124_0572 [Porticoccaceae bacterium]
MRRRRAGLPEAGLSFLDVISCGFGAVVLLLIIAPVGSAPPPEVDLEPVRALRARLLEVRAANREAAATLARLQAEAHRLAAEEAQRAAPPPPPAGGEADRLELALQVLTEEMERLAPRARPQPLIGGIPVDSEYVIFVIDTSGSMQSGAWPKVQEVMVRVLEVYPRVRGIQVMNDMGQYLFGGPRGEWLADTPETRRRILSALAHWAPFSNSSPVEGIEAAIRDFYRRDRRISVYTLGDDFTGRSIRAVAEAVARLNRAHLGKGRLVRVHAIGFPVHLRPGGPPTANAIRFAALMRRLSYDNGGTFIGLPTLAPDR